MRYKWMLGCVCTLLFLFLGMESSFAAEIPDYFEEELDYDSIQDVVNSVMGEEQLSFTDLVGKLFQGDQEQSTEVILSQLKGSLTVGLQNQIGTFSKLVSLALIAAVFTNLALAFRYNQVAETGFFVSYLLIVVMITTSFVTASTIATKTITAVIEFMKALVPTYFLIVGFCNGSASSIGFYQGTLVIISVVNYLFIYAIIPMVNVILMLNLANNISKEDMLSKLSGLLENIVSWSLKTMLAVVIGFQTIQGLILPVSDKVKRSFFYKASEAIPGIGNVIGSVTETVFSAGTLLKNAVGVAGLVIIVSICLAPILRLLIITLIYRFSGAILQPISDKRILECVGATGKACALLLQTVFIAAVLFMITITIVAITTKTGM